MMYAFLLIIASSIPRIVLSADSADPVPLDLGHLADNLMSPITMAAGFLNGISVIIGAICLFSSVVRYMQHRVNPLAQPLGTVVLLLVLGIVLLALPLVDQLTESGVPFHLHLPLHRAIFQ